MRTYKPHRCRSKEEQAMNASEFAEYISNRRIKK